MPRKVNVFKRLAEAVAGRSDHDGAKLVWVLRWTFECFIINPMFFYIVPRQELSEQLANIAETTQATFLILPTIS